MDINDRIIISQLFEEYGALLTEKQRDILSLYCDMDLSLFEIAEKYGVSRQAIRDSILRSVASLHEYESKLGAYGFRQSIQDILSSDLNDSEKLERIRKLME